MTLLDKLYYDLQTYIPEPRDVETINSPDKSKQSIFSAITNVFKSSNEIIERPKSLYIYGGAGSGKVFIILFIYFIVL